MAYLFSIKPEYCAQIFDGLKTVELRRRVSPKISVGSLMLIYETTPTKAVTGAAVITSVKAMPLRSLWGLAEREGGILRDAFFAYFDGLEDGFAIGLASAVQFPTPVPLNALTQYYSLQAPQSYREIPDHLTAALLRHGQISIGHQYSDTGGRCESDAGFLRLAAA
ncbi:ASCH domain-containing protein [Brevundimonas sp. Bb-A]|uniref:ASCH domain-containing protein n=1 Tax=Brevundimonas sp. Bb-A TaxID=2560058 RepID=UPI00128F7B00